MYKKSDILRNILCYFSFRRAFCLLLLFLAFNAAAFSAPGPASAAGSENSGSSSANSNSAAARPSSAPGELDLSLTEESWMAVLSGRAVSRPVKTAYGFAVLTDGKMVSAFTGGGKVIWQKGIPGTATGFVKAAPGDFLFIPLKGKKICALNPSGITLWKKDLSFEIKAAPLTGRDGRIFVFGKNNAACLGLNGLEKWCIQTETLNLSLEPSELEDGSILLWAGALEGKKSVAFRVSPFGEIMERIVFAGEVTASYSCADGVLLSFSDGSLGLCSYSSKYNSVISKWVIATKEKGLSSSVRFIKTGSPEIAAAVSLYGEKSRLLFVNTRAGLIESEADLPFLAQEAYFSGGRLFLSDGRLAWIFDADAGGKIQSPAPVCKIRLLPKGKALNWDYVLYSASSVIFTARNWSVHGFRVFNEEPKKEPLDFAAKKNSGYPDFVKDAGSDIKRIRKAASSERKEELLKGGYGKKEEYFIHDASFIMESYFDSRARKASFGGTITDWTLDEFSSFSLTEEEAVISMLPLFESGTAQEYLGRVLEREQDLSLLVSALKAVCACGYDGDGRIMAAIEQIIKKARPAQTALLDQCCQALYSVCRFMGRPALYKKGLSILKNLMLPQYPDSTKESARKVYEKLAKLQL